MIELEYKELSGEVEFVNNLILERLNISDEIKTAYKGCQILFSPLIYRPSILFVGMNPGAGFFKQNNKPVLKLQPQDKLEYLENYKYRLLTQTLDVFKKSGKYSLLENSVKSNFDFFATENVDHLKKFRKSVQKELDINLYHKSFEWSKKLLKIIEPQTIICEGKGAFDNIMKLYEIDLLKYAWDNKSYIEYKDDKLHIIGYKRSLFGILKRDALANFLSNALN